MKVSELRQRAEASLSEILSLNRDLLAAVQQPKAYSRSSKTATVGRLASELGLYKIVCDAILQSTALSAVDEDLDIGALTSVLGDKLTVVLAGDFCELRLGIRSLREEDGS